MGLLSSSKSSSVVNYHTATTTTNQDQRLAAGDNSLVVRLDGGSNLDQSDRSTNTINNYSADASVISAAGATVAGVLPFLSGESKKAFDLVGDAYGKFSAETASMFRDANSRAASAEAAAYSFSRNTLDNTLNFSRDTLDVARGQSETALAAIRQTSSSLLDYITQREKDPNERAFSQVMPWLVGGGVIVAIFAFGGGKK